MNKIKIVFKGITEIVGGSEMGLLVLTDEAETKQIAIICDRHTEYEFSLRIGKASITHRLLPEVLCWINPDMDTEHYEVFFISILDGQYQAVLLNKNTLEMTKIRASDGILLASIAQLDIYMEEKLFGRQSVPYESGKTRVALPVNALSSTMLENALEKAIEDENYELASNLRDELQKRKKNDNQQD